MPNDIALPVRCPAYRDGKHRLKMIDFNETTFVGKFKCRKCSFTKKRKAAIVCMEDK